MQHVKNIRGAPNIARAHDNSIGSPRHNIREHFPFGKALVFLKHGARVHHGPCVSNFIGGVEHDFKVARHLGRVIPCATHFHGAWNIFWYRVAHGL